MPGNVFIQILREFISFHTLVSVNLWLFYVFVLSCVCYVFVRVCLHVLCGHLMGKGWPLGSRLSCLTVSLPLSHWYPGSGVVLDCIDSWSLHPYLLSEGLIILTYFLILGRQNPLKLYMWELSGRVLDSRPKGRVFEPHRRHCVVVLEQDTCILALYWFNPGRPVTI